MDRIKVLHDCELRVRLYNFETGKCYRLVIDAKKGEHYDIETMCNVEGGIKFIKC
jgi:phosphoribosylformylglycinamidine (FGAM) synthase PurS component